MDNSINKKLIFRIFTSTFSLSAFTFGGGYVIVPLMRKKFTEDLGWLEEDEMLEYVALAQSAPGALALNCATLVGYRMGGVLGALAGLFGTALPPFIMLSLVYIIYDFIKDNSLVAAAIRGMQSGIAAVIASTVFDMAKPFFKAGKLPSLLIMISAFIATWFFGVNVALILLGAGVLGAVYTVVRKKPRGGKSL